MKKITTSLASAVCLLCAGTAHAGIYKFDFTATDFLPTFETYPLAPQASITGQITFTADSLGAPITSINAIDVTIAGHEYTVGEIGSLQWPFSNYLFGGTAWKINGAHTNTDDFWVTGRSLTYSTSGEFGMWRSSNITTSYTELVADVPEPGSLALLLAGASGLGVLLRRRRR